MKLIAIILAGAAVFGTLTILHLSIVQPARAATGPSVIPQGATDNEFIALRNLDSTMRTLVQKMNVDIELRRDLIYAMQVISTYAQAQACMLADRAQNADFYDAMACDDMLAAFRAANGRAQ